MTKAEKIGRNHAIEALDQVDSFRSVDEAIDSYFNNLGDTLREEGLLDHASEARRGFEDVLKARGINVTF